MRPGRSPQGSWPLQLGIDLFAALVLCAFPPEIVKSTLGPGTPRIRLGHGMGDTKIPRWRHGLPEMADIALRFGFLWFTDLFSGWYS